MKNDLILGLVFLVLALIGIVLKKTYYLLPKTELKRRAEQRDPVAIKLYKAVTYGSSLSTILWLFIGLSAAASFILLAKALPIWLGLLIVAPLIYLVFSLLPAAHVNRPMIILTELVTPLLAGLLNLIHSPLSKVSRVFERFYPPKHTGLFERHDLLELIKRQKNQADSRLSNEELEIIKRALTFQDKKVKDVLRPRKKVKTLISSDTVGPILIDELHKNSQEHVLVRESSKGPVIGALAFKDLNLKSHGQVKDIMNPRLHYLHENDSLSEALHAFFQTNQSLFVVTNNFEEYVGIVTIEDVLRALLGHIAGDDFEAYTNIMAVANRHQRKVTEAEETKSEDKTAVKTDA